MNKIILMTVMAFAIGRAHGQIFNFKKKNYEPIFEIPGKTCVPSGLDIHDKYVGKIVFSDRQLTKENTNESMFKSSFELGSHIYARVFTSNSVQNYMLYSKSHGQTQAGETANQRYSYMCIYYIDGVNVLEWRKSNNSDQGLYNVNTWQMWVNVPEFSKYDWMGKEMRETLNALKPGTHKVKVELWAGETSDNPSSHITSIRPIAEGEFDLNVTEGTKIKIGKKWSDTQDGKMDPKIKAEAVKLFTEDLKVNYPTYTIKAFKCPQDDYGIQKDEYSLVQFRYVNIYAYATDKTGKCFLLSALYSQDYAGGGRYSTALKKWGHTNEQELDCE